MERYKNRHVGNSQQELEDLHKQGYDFQVEQSPEGSSGYDSFIFRNDNEIATTQGYDTTRLKIIKPQYYSGLNTEKTPVYTCEVSWYNSDGTVMMSENGELKPVYAYSEIVQVELDLDTLENISDSLYIRELMRTLLNKKRVSRYTEAGKKSKLVEGGYRQLYCGNYVGFISDSYTKAIDTKIAQASHNSPEVLQLRNDYQRSRLNDILSKLKSNEKAKARNTNQISELTRVNEQIDAENLRLREEFEHLIKTHPELATESTNHPTHDDDDGR